MDFGSAMAIFCSVAFFPYGNVLLDELVPVSLRYLVKGRDDVDVSRSTCSSAANVHELTMLSTNFLGNLYSCALALDRKLVSSQDASNVYSPIQHIASQ